MAVYTHEQRIFIVESFIRNNESCMAVQREFVKHFHAGHHPSRHTIYRIIAKWRKHGSIENLSKRKSGRRISIRTPENIERVQKALQENPQNSSRRAAQQLGISKSSLLRILHKDLQLYPYKIQLKQSLTSKHKDGRLKFANEFLPTFPALADLIWFTDEAHFHLNGYVNKQNMRFWASQNPQLTIETFLHPQRVTVWCAISKHGIFGPEFIEGTVTSKSYSKLLTEEVIPVFQGLNILETAYFQQDGAKPHTSNSVLDILYEHFGGRIVSNRFPKRFDCGFQWPPYSPDLNPCDYFLWGYLKDNVYKNNPQSIDELKLAITKEINGISVNILQKVIDNFGIRLERVQQLKGGHIENVIVH